MKQLSLFFFVALLLLCNGLFAQSDSTKKHQVAIENRSIIDFDVDSQYYHLVNIKVSGNKRTREPYITRELELKVGDSVLGHRLMKKMERSRFNLNNISIFNFIQIKAVLIDDHQFEFQVDVIEQWTLWPALTLLFGDRNFNSWIEHGAKFNRLILGINVNDKNLFGRLHHATAYIQIGYDKKYTLHYQIPFLNKKQTIGIRVGGGYALQREVAYNTDSVGKPQLVKPEKGFASQHAMGLVELIYRPKYHDNFFLGINYDYYTIADTALQSNPSFMPDSVKNHQQFLSPYLLYKHDFRDYKHYPLKGYFIEAQAKWYVFQMISPQAKDVAVFDAKFNWYKPVARRWFYNTGIHLNGMIGETNPFFLQNGLGYGRDFVRGYESITINGQYFGLWKHNFKFALVPPGSFDLGFIKSKMFSSIHYAFYLNAFFDMGYVGNTIPLQHHTTTLRPFDQKFIYAAGLGIDFVTYYNLCCRGEISINRDGKFGFAFHLDAPL